jgi:dual specificity protein kinase YAK1
LAHTLLVLSDTATHTACMQQVARLLNDTYDPDDAKHIVRLMDCFAAHNHLCLVFELLSINIYELLKTNQFRGLPLPMIRSFTKQVSIATLSC